MEPFHHMHMLYLTPSADPELACAPPRAVHPPTDIVGVANYVREGF